MYDDHLRLIGKRVVDFLLVLIELSRYMLRLKRYERISVQNRRLRSNGGPVDPKFQVEGVAPTNHSSSQKTRLNGLSCGIEI